MVSGLCKVVTLSRFGSTCSTNDYRRCVEVNEGCDQCLFYCHAKVTDSYKRCPFSGHVSHTLWIHQILEGMRRPE